MIAVSVPWRSTGHWRDLRIWLLDNASHYEIGGVHGDNVHNRVVYFLYEREAALFALKWS